MPYCLTPSFMQLLLKVYLLIHLRINSFILPLIIIKNIQNFRFKCFYRFKQEERVWKCVLSWHSSWNCKYLCKICVICMYVVYVGWARGWFGNHVKNWAVQLNFLLLLFYFYFINKEIIFDRCGYKKIFTIKQRI